MALEFDSRVCPERRKDLEEAQERGKAFVALMGEGNIGAARRALEKAIALMDGEAHGFCQMCGENPLKYSLCSKCFFRAHSKDK